MSIGNNIKALRIQDGMTQKELGLALGFSENAAGVRIAQYESGVRTPKKDLLAKIAYYFMVEPAVLTAPDLDTYVSMMDTLNELDTMCKQASLQIANYIKQLSEAAQS